MSNQDDIPKPPITNQANTQFSADINYDTNKLNLYLPSFTSTVSNSLTWRLWHGINYMLGGILFVLGSLCYFPEISKYVNGDVAGGWLFTVGSTNFLLADVTEWMHFKWGCMPSSIPAIAKENDIDTSCYGKFRRVELGLNFFCSAIGSFMYLLGSIFFIPATNLLSTGENFFIIGSIVIFLSQTWKCIRTSYTN